MNSTKIEKSVTDTILFCIFMGYYIWREQVWKFN